MAYTHVVATFPARMQAREKARSRRKEILERLEELDIDLKSYVKIFNRVKNFSNEEWRKLIREPERRIKMIDTLKLHCDQLNLQAKQFESQRHQS